MDEKTIRVALVDDHELLRNGLARIIGKFEGYEVIFEAGNGEEFIQNLEQNENPDVILLDISMPIMDGFQTAAWIRENLPECKVLVLSMMDNESAVIRMLQLGARGYILKDTKPVELEKALGQIVSTGYYSNELVTNKQIHLASKGQAEELAPAKVSAREEEFLKYVCLDLTYKEIAQKMNASPRTIDNYRDALFEKFDIKTRVGLALFAIKNGYFAI